MYVWCKMFWKDQYVNVINTKNYNRTTSNNNVRVGQSDVEVKNQTFNFMENTEDHFSSMINQINSVCDLNARRSEM